MYDPKATKHLNFYRIQKHFLLDDHSFDQNENVTTGRCVY